jgi:7-cyano-7-deazaguanine synthase
MSSDSTSPRYEDPTEASSRDGGSAVGNRAIVLLSGGLDSATTMAVARSQGYQLHALTLRCGEHQDAKLEAARRLAAWFGVADHWEVEVDQRHFDSTARAGRNTVFLSFAVAWAEALEIDDLFLGVTAADHRHRPDARRGWIEAFERMANLATKRRISGHSLQIHTPLIFLTAVQVVRRGGELGVNYSLTRNCDRPSTAGEACGGCESCLNRLAAFASNGLKDPSPYLVQAAA